MYVALRQAGLLFSPPTYACFPLSLCHLFSRLPSFHLVLFSQQHSQQSLPCTGQAGAAADERHSGLHGGKPQDRLFPSCSAPQPGVQRWQPPVSVIHRRPRALASTQHRYSRQHNEDAAVVVVLVVSTTTAAAAKRLVP